MKLPSSRRGSMQLAVILSLIALIVVGTIAVLIFWPWDPRPSGRFSVEPIRPAKDIATVVEMPTGPGDGGEDVHQAISGFLDKSEQIRQERAVRRGDVKGLVEQIDQIERDGVTGGTVVPFTSSTQLLAAAGKGEFKYAENHLKDLKLQWQPPTRLLVAMEYVARAALIEGAVAEKRGRRDQAEQIYKAVLIYGKRLADCQVRVWIQMEGYDAQELTAQALAGLWEKQDAAKAQAALDYRNAVAAANRKANRLFGELCNRVNVWHAGDLLLFARDHSEPAWRVEAILSMGMARLNPSGRKYNKALMRYLKKAIHDQNPWVVRASEWSLDLTKDVYNSQTAGEE